jgi:hypothetical protein
MKYPTFIVITANILSHQLCPSPLTGKTYIKYPTPEINTVIPARGRSILNLHGRPPQPPCCTTTSAD